MTNSTDQFKAKLTKAKDEILAQIALLKQEELSPKGESALQAIESQATAMVDISLPPAQTP